MRLIGKNIRRAPVKSLLSASLALLLLGVIGQFTVLRGIYRDVYDNIEVKAYFVDGLNLSSSVEVGESGYVRSPYFENAVSILECNFSRVRVVMTNDALRFAECNNFEMDEIEFLEGYDIESFSAVSNGETIYAYLKAVSWTRLASYRAIRCGLIKRSF